MGATLGPSLGPTLGGWITNQWSWPWIFYVNVPLGIARRDFCVGAICPSRKWRAPRAGRRLARASRCSWSASARCRPFLERGNRLDWFESDLIVALAAIAAIALGLFVWHELRTEHPVVDLRVFRHRALAVGCVYGAVMGVGLYGSVFLFPLFTQQVLHWTSWQSGLAIAPSSLATALMMPIAGRLVWRIGPAPLFAIGIALFMPDAVEHESLDAPERRLGSVLAADRPRHRDGPDVRAALDVDAAQPAARRTCCRARASTTCSARRAAAWASRSLATLIDHRSGAAPRVPVGERVAVQCRDAAAPAGARRRAWRRAGSIRPARSRPRASALDGTIAAQSAVLAFRDCYLVHPRPVRAARSPLIPLLRRPPDVITA